MPRIARTLGFSVGLCAGAIALLAASGCNQGENERCQVNSDCAGGLVCYDGQSGNGLCKPSNSTSLLSDAAADAPVTGATDTKPAVDSGVALDTTGVPDVSSPLDSAAVDALAVDATASDARPVDTTTVDTTTIDATAIDTL
jgi:hypothetical protein